MRVIDLETRSLSDLRTEGGHKYALDPKTEILTACWTDDGKVFHCWFPRLVGVSQALLDLQLPGVVCHFGPMPETLRVPEDREWIGHNSWGFDEPVWVEQLKRLDTGVTVSYPVWQDTQAHASQAGLPAKLDLIGKRLWGEGKYEEGAKLLKAASQEPHDPPVGTWVLIAKYCVQDVKLTWDLVEHLKGFPVHPSERMVMQAHRAINNRGVRVDPDLTAALMRLSNEAVDHAVAEVSKITGGALASQKDLRSAVKMKAWLASMGADVGKGKGKKQADGSISTSLAKAVWKQWVEKTLTEDDELEESYDDGEDEGEGVVTPALQKVVWVLQLRDAALRVTAGKLTAAGVGSVEVAARVPWLPCYFLYGLHAYYAALTGRFGGRRLQTQNLPRPKEGVPYWALVELFEGTGSLSVAAVKELNKAYLATLFTKDPNSGATLASLDDCASALIRAILVPSAPGETLLAADLSGIESRVLAWLGPEKWKMQAFWDFKCAYIEFCFKVTGQRVDRKHPLRQLFKVIELGAGYQIGGDKMALYCAANRIDLSAHGLTGASAVDAWRDANPSIAGEVQGFVKGRKWRRGGVWNDYMDAAVAACGGARVESHRCLFEKHGADLWITLPSGRSLVYRNCRLGTQQVFGKDRPSLTYTSPRFVDAKLYGGKLCENVTQAIARDVMCNSIVGMEEAGIPVVLHVHDEAVASGDRGLFGPFMTHMTTPPDWLTEFPLDAEGSCSPRYCKSPPPGVKDELWRNGKRVGA